MALKSTKMAGVLKGVVGSLAFAFLLYWVDFSAVVRCLADISLIDLVALFSVSMILIYVSVLKWKAFLERLGISASVPRLFRLYLLGYFVNLLMPSSLGGDLVRSVYVGKNVDKVRAVSATLLERYTGFVAMVVMASIAIWWAPQVTPAMRFATAALVIVAVSSAALLMTGRFEAISRWVRLPDRIHAKVVRLQEGMSWGLKDRDLLIRTGLLSILFHLLTVVNTAVVAYAVGWELIPWADLLVVVPLILLVGAIPVSPQGLGIQEGAFLFFLHSVGATSEQAVAVALTLRAKSYVLAAVGGCVWLGLRREERKSALVDGAV